MRDLREMDVFEFPKEIFETLADVRCTVIVPVPQLDAMHIRSVQETQKALRSVFGDYAGPAGVGFYSLDHGPAGVLALSQMHLRPTIALERTRFGPTTVMRAVFASCVFSGALPVDLTDLMSTVDSLSEEFKRLADLHPREKIETENYHLFHADRGNVIYTGFSKDQPFNPSDLTTFSKIERNDGRVFSYVRGDRARKIDITDYCRVVTQISAD